MSVTWASTRERIEKVAVLRSQGLTTAEIARALDCTTRTVQRCAVRAPTEEADPAMTPTIPGGREAQAACRAHDPELFFPEWYLTTRPEVRRAKAVCRSCPVLIECLEYALATHQNHGIWGGLTPSERRRVRIRRESGVAA